MNYLIEINVPGEGWQPLEIRYREKSLDAFLRRIREVNVDDEIHDVRVKALKTKEELLPAIEKCLNYWKHPRKAA